MDAGGHEKNGSCQESLQQAVAAANAAAASPATLMPSWSDRCFANNYSAIYTTHASQVYQAGNVTGHYLPTQYSQGMQEFIPVTQVYHGFAGAVSGYSTPTYAMEASQVLMSRPTTSLLIAQPNQHQHHINQQQQQLQQQPQQQQQLQQQTTQQQQQLQQQQPLHQQQLPQNQQQQQSVLSQHDRTSQARVAEIPPSMVGQSHNGICMPPQKEVVVQVATMSSHGPVTAGPRVVIGAAIPLPTGRSLLRPRGSAGASHEETAADTGDDMRQQLSNGSTAARNGGGQSNLAWQRQSRSSGGVNTDRYSSNNARADGDYDSEEHDSGASDDASDNNDDDDDCDYDIEYCGAQAGRRLASAATASENGRDGRAAQQQQQQSVRKSTRLAAIMEAAAPTAAAEAAYEPQPYNPNSLWCEDCMCLPQAGCCYQHVLRRVTDNRFKPRARATLPACLTLEELPRSEPALEQTGYRVLAKHHLSRNTQFGPYVARLVDSKDQIPERYSHFFLKVTLADDSETYLCPGDENECNWMMHVRSAATRQEQNAVAYEHAGSVYFTTIRDLNARDELKVWYAAHYALHLGQSLLYSLPVRSSAFEAPTAPAGVAPETSQSEAIPALNCDECPQKFATQELLTEHWMLVHSHVTTAERPRRRYKRKGVFQKKGGRRGRPPKHGGTSLTSSTVQSVGVRYLNKYKKLKKQSQQKAAIGSQRHRLLGGVGGVGFESLRLSNVWQCSSCELRFGSAALLEAHLWLHEDTDVTAEAGDPQQQGHVGAASGGGRAEDTCASTAGGSGFVGGPFLCPACSLPFAGRLQLASHVGERHAKTRRVFKCVVCLKGFTSDERRSRHMACHGGDQSKPLQCHVCGHRFVNNSALSCHLKVHSRAKYYGCLVCDAAFGQVADLKAHAPTHRDPADGTFECPHCRKRFAEFDAVRKHVRTIHSSRRLECPHCDKVFSRSDKLRLHALCHSDAREFMCDACGKQFKRKDKLKEHIARVHALDRPGAVTFQSRSGCGASSGGIGSQHLRGGCGPDGRVASRAASKAQAAGYQRFDYKCHLCQMGFKRRGMLVNHLARRHPDVPPASVPELSRPIFRAQRDYYCNHCDKVYKSSSKRKAHILRAHPGQTLPASERQFARVAAAAAAAASVSGDGGGESAEVAAHPMALPSTFTQTVGSVTATPNPCEYCHKEYATKAKLLQHQRKKHPNLAPPLLKQARRRRSAVRGVRAASASAGSMLDAQAAADHAALVAGGSGGEALLHPVDADALAITVHSALPVGSSVGGGGVGEPTADLLTQAMSELQSLGDFRQQATTVSFIPARIVHSSSSQTLAAAAARAGGTIDFCQLSLAAFPQAGQLGQVLVATANPASLGASIATSQPNPGQPTVTWPYAFN